jgi:lipopolysaccharide export system ATP-binding protein
LDATFEDYRHPGMNLLETTKLVKTYGGRTVVNEVSFVLEQREIVGMLGRNGAGKTTTFRMILGMVTPDSGAVAFDATDITHLPMYKRARLGIGYLPQDRSDFRRLTVWQNLQAILETLGIDRKERIRRGERLLDQYGLLKNKNQPAEKLSGGERRRMEIARALVTEPKLILLDEPFAAVDPLTKEDLSREVKRLRDEFDKTVLITDHDVAFTLGVVERAMIISDGKVFAEGTPKQIINNPLVRKEYLGNTFRGDEFDVNLVELRSRLVQKFPGTQFIPAAPDVITAIRNAHPTVPPAFLRFLGELGQCSVGPGAFKIYGRLLEARDVLTADAAARLDNVYLVADAFDGTYVALDSRDDWAVGRVDSAGRFTRAADTVDFAEYVDRHLATHHQ